MDDLHRHAAPRAGKNLKSLENLPLPTQITANGAPLTAFRTSEDVTIILRFYDELVKTGAAAEKNRKKTQAMAVKRHILVDDAQRKARAHANVSIGRTPAYCNFVARPQFPSFTGDIDRLWVGERVAPNRGGVKRGFIFNADGASSCRR